MPFPPKKLSTRGLLCKVRGENWLIMWSIMDVQNLRCFEVTTSAKLHTPVSVYLTWLLPKFVPRIWACHRTTNVRPFSFFIILRYRHTQKHSSTGSPTTICSELAQLILRKAQLCRLLRLVGVLGGEIAE